MLEDSLAARVVADEVSHVVDLSVDDHPEVLDSVVLADLSEVDGGKVS